MTDSPRRRNIELTVILAVTIITFLIGGSLLWNVLNITPTPTPVSTTTNAAPAVPLVVGLPDHQIDLRLPGAVQLSVTSSDVTRSQNPEVKIGAFVTSDSLEKVWQVYLPKLQAAGYKWDYEDACSPDPEKTCPNLRYYTADIYNCYPSQNNSQSCGASYQINFWWVAAQAGPQELKLARLPQSILT